MSITIHSVVNGRTPNEEYVKLKASAPVNLKGYALVDRTFDAAGKVSNEFRHIFVFPDLTIGKDDWVRVYSGKGTYRKINLETGKGHRHDLYWQADACVWNNAGGDRASLIEYTVIDSEPVPALV